MTMHSAENPPVVACLAEALWDCFPDGKVVGGAPLNCAFMLHALGAKVVLITRVGNDANGRELVNFVEGHGLDATWVQIDDEHETGHVDVTLDTSGNPTYDICENVAYDHIQWRPELAEPLRSCDAICFGTLCQRTPATRAAFMRMLDAAPDAVKVYDVNLRQDYYSREILEECMGRSAVVKMNDEEVKTLAGMFAEDSETGVRSMIRRFGIDLLAVTRGPNGCLLYRGDEKVDVPGIKITVQDTVGSGDAFTARLILACLNNEPLQTMGEEANLLGAYVATRRGATPPIDGYREKMASLRKY